MDNEKPERDFKGIWIPKEIWESKELSLQEKVFLVEIDSLDNEKNCFASNKYFAEFFGLSKGRCSQIINSLEKKRLIKIEYKRDGKEITERIIRVVNKLNRYLGNDDLGIKYSKGGYLGNDKENNTLVNNTLVNNTSNINIIVEKYNSLGLSKVNKITTARQNKVKARIKEYGLDFILDTLDMVKQSDFLMGKNSDWKANFDWLFKNNDNLLKISEGNYKNVAKKQKYEVYKNKKDTQEDLDKAYQDLKELHNKVMGVKKNKKSQGEKKWNINLEI